MSAYAAQRVIGQLRAFYGINDVVLLLSSIYLFIEKHLGLLSIKVLEV